MPEDFVKLSAHSESLQDSGDRGHRTGDKVSFSYLLTSLHVVLVLRVPTWVPGRPLEKC